MNFSIRLKQLRLEHKLTQEQLGKIINKNRSTVAGYESENKQPDFDTLKRLADYFDVSTDYLLGKTDIRNPYDEFLSQAKEQYGPRGKKQAEELLENVRSLFDGGELPDEDKDEFFRAITEIYFESKEKNRKYIPKKYRKQEKADK